MDWIGMDWIYYIDVAERGYMENIFFSVESIGIRYHNFTESGKALRHLA